MDRPADLDSALSFVIRRIGEQATRSGDPVSEELSMLLNYLPTSAPRGGGSEENPVPRNFDYERLCTLARAAYLSDRQANPSSLDWEFAFAVFALNRHPMWGLLNAAAVKRRRPVSDKVLFLFTALLFLFALIVMASHGRWNPRHLEEVGSGGLVVIVLMYFASLRIEKRRLQKDIERCRIACRLSAR